MAALIRSMSSSSASSSEPERCHAGVCKKGQTVKPHEFSFARYKRERCTKVCEAGSKLCAPCKKVEAAFRGGKLGLWHGFHGANVAEGSHAEGGEWAAAQNARNAARLAKEAVSGVPGGAAIVAAATAGANAAAGAIAKAAKITRKATTAITALKRVAAAGAKRAQTAAKRAELLRSSSSGSSSSGSSSSGSSSSGSSSSGSSSSGSSSSGSSSSRRRTSKRRSSNKAPMTLIYKRASSPPIRAASGASADRPTSPDFPRRAAYSENWGRQVSPNSEKMEPVRFFDQRPPVAE